jgi:hypothetical protein
VIIATKMCTLTFTLTLTLTPHPSPLTLTLTLTLALTRCGFNDRFTWFREDGGGTRVTRDQESLIRKAPAALCGQAVTCADSHTQLVESAEASLALRVAPTYQRANLLATHVLISALTLTTRWSSRSRPRSSG